MKAKPDKHSKSIDWPDPPIEDRLYIGLEQISQALNLFFEREGWQHGLSTLQMKLMLSLLEPHHARTVGNAAKEMNLTPPTLSDAAQTLSHKKLVKKERNVQDNRIVELQLSPKGRTLALKMKNKRNLLTRIISALSPQEKSDLLGILIKLTKGFMDHGLISISRMCVNCQFFQPNKYPGSEKPHHCGFVDMPFGGPDLRTDCPDYLTIETERRKKP